MDSGICIGTWNVGYASTARNPQRLHLIEKADTDIWVLTETQDGLNLGLGGSYSAVHSEPHPQKPAPARWVTIWSRHPLIDRVRVRDPIRTTAALRHSPWQVAGLWHGHAVAVGSRADRRSAELDGAPPRCPRAGERVVQAARSAR